MFENVPDQWAIINKTLMIYKVGVISISTVALGLLVAVFCLAFADPIVVVKDGDNKEVYQSKRQEVKVTDQDIKNFVKEFVVLRYVWKEFNPQKTVKMIEPLTTPNFRRKLFKLM